MVNRKKASKKRNNKHVPLSDDLLHELSKEHMTSQLGLPQTGPHHPAAALMNPSLSMGMGMGMGVGFGHHHHHHHPPAHHPPPSYHATSSSNMAMADDSSHSSGDGVPRRGRGERDRERDRDSSEREESFLETRNKYPGFAGRARPAVSNVL